MNIKKYRPAIIIAVALIMLIIISLLILRTQTQSISATPTPDEASLPHKDNDVPVHIHDWIEANCFDPKTCSDCNETQGNPLKHDWKDANYQEPQVCVICGEISGEVLSPEWMIYTDDPLLVMLLELIENNDHEMVSGESQQLSNWWSDDKIVGEIDVINHENFESREDLPAKDGYEYQAVTFELTFNNQNNHRHSVHQNFVLIDLYNLEVGHDTDNNRLFINDGLISYVSIKQEDIPELDIPELVQGNFMLNFYGEEYEFFIFTNEEDIWAAGNNETSTKTLELVVLVPVGYDGFVIRFPGNLEKPFFRLQSAG